MAHLVTHWTRSSNRSRVRIQQSGFQVGEELMSTEHLKENIRILGTRPPFQVSTATGVTCEQTILILKEELAWRKKQPGIDRETMIDKSEVSVNAGGKLSAPKPALGPSAAFTDEPDDEPEDRGPQYPGAKPFTAEDFEVRAITDEEAKLARDRREAMQQEKQSNQQPMASTPDEFPGMEPVVNTKITNPQQHNAVTEQLAEAVFAQPKESNPHMVGGGYQPAVIQQYPPVQNISAMHQPSGNYGHAMMQKAQNMAEDSSLSIKFNLHVAGQLKEIISDYKLAKSIQGKSFVELEGWQFVGAYMKEHPRVIKVDTGTDANGRFWAMAQVEVVNEQGIVVGGSFGYCSNSESIKSKYDPYAIISMAQTRAVSKAFRNKYAFMIKVAGYEVTPYEEMAGVDTMTGGEGEAAPRPAAGGKLATKVQREEMAELIKSEYLEDDYKAAAQGKLDNPNTTKSDMEVCIQEVKDNIVANNF